MTNYAGQVALALTETALGGTIFVGCCIAIAKLAFPKRRHPVDITASMRQAEDLPPHVRLEEIGRRMRADAMEAARLPRFYARQFEGVWMVFDRRANASFRPTSVRCYTTRRAAMLGAKRLNDRAARGAPYLPEHLRP